MIGKIVSVVVNIVKLLVPKKVYLWARNLYRLVNLDAKELKKALDRNVVDFEQIVEGFERTKQRTIIMDGKLNYLLYGKATDHAGTIHKNLIKHPVSREKMDHLFSFTTLLRGDVESLRTRYFHRLEYMTAHGFFGADEFKKATSLPSGHSL